jgi:hypothetical protein
VPTRLSSRPTPVLNRSRLTRNTGDMLVNDPDGWMSDGMHGPVWWLGSDSGGGRSPIGPRPPWGVVNDGFGNGPTGYWPTWQADALACVVRATSLMVDPIADSPFRVQELGFGGQPLPTPRWLTDPMLARPDARFTSDVAPAALKLTRSKFWRDLLCMSLWWGLGSFIYQEQQTEGSTEPLAGTMRLIHPKFLGTVRDDSGTLVWALNPGGGTDEVLFDRDGYVTVGGVQYRIAVLRNPLSPVDEDGLSLGVFGMSPGTFAFAAELANYASGQFRSGVPNGVLQVTAPGLTGEEAQALKARWMEAHGGGRRSIAVLNATTTFTPFNLSPVDAELTQVKTLNIADVAFAFGMDPNMLGAGLQNSASYNNVRDYFRQHRDLTLGPWISALQDLLSSLLPGTAGVRVDLDQFTRAEPQERYAAYAQAIGAGILTVDEVRELEGLPPLPEPPPPEPVPEALAGTGEPSPSVEEPVGDSTSPTVEEQARADERRARIRQLLDAKAAAS